MAPNDNAHIRLSAFLSQGRAEGVAPRLDWRLEAKAPGDEWTLRHTIGFGSARVPGQSYPPSRDDMVALLIELLMGMEWTPDGVLFS